MLERFAGKFRDAHRDSNDPKSLFRPVTAEDRVADEAWKRKLGFRFSELRLNNEEVEILVKPFRSPKEEVLFAALRETGEIAVSEPVSLEELDEIPENERAKLIVGRLGGKGGVRKYVQLRVRMLKAFRALVDRSEEASVQNELLERLSKNS